MGNSNTRVLVLGAGGMLGSTLLRYLWLKSDLEVCGTARSAHTANCLPEELRSHVRVNIDVENLDHLLSLFAEVSPDVVLNCVGIVKQLPDAYEPLSAIPINSLLPHRLAKLCAASGARLIHFSTDCVFSGSGGMYKESDLPDALDLYGRSKLMGEVDYSNALTLRTSLIGHELRGNRSLVDWFLSQTGSVRGFRRAVFSGLPTVEVARVVHEVVLPRNDLRGVYHLSVDPISKFDLISLVAAIYRKEIAIIPDDSLEIDRSLDSSRFRAATGFAPKPWGELIQAMNEFG